jgi:hypothetical protein
MFKKLVRQFILNFSASYALHKTIQEGIIDSATNITNSIFDKN